MLQPRLRSLTPGTSSSSSTGFSIIISRVLRFLFARPFSRFASLIAYRLSLENTCAQPDTRTADGYIQQLLYSFVNFPDDDVRRVIIILLYQARARYAQYIAGENFVGRHTSLSLFPFSYVRRELPLLCEPGLCNADYTRERERERE